MDGEQSGFRGLVALMDRLRDPGGCPWDREQTYATLRGYLLEEAYEVAEALDRGERAELCDELGDLLFQIVFLARLAAEEGAFGIDDVIAGITGKMVRRHPHVFGSAVASTSDEVLRNWEAIKRQERSSPGTAARTASLLDGIPAALPALLTAQRLGTKAARVGFDWEGVEQLLDKVDEELAELREAVRGDRQERVHEELGDLLFTLAMVGRRAAVDPEGALAAANHKFRRRFGWIEDELRRRGVAPDGAGIALLEELWGQAKDAEARPD